MEDVDLSAAARARIARLEAFSHFLVEDIQERLGEIQWQPWPEIQGCFVLLFTARSGSTFLCREMERTFNIGRMGESLNPAPVKGRPVAEVVRRRQDAWFAFKAGLQGVVAAEICGFFDAYLDKTVFIRLIRRDLVAQAVSYVRAMQTDQWHRADEARREPTYDRQAIAKAVRKLGSGVNQLGDYARRTGRPCRTLIYEDFAEGDIAPAIEAGDVMGLPRFPDGAKVEHRPVQRMSDALNLEWKERFMEEADVSIRKRIEAHERAAADVTP